MKLFIQSLSLILTFSLYSTMANGKSHLVDHISQAKLCELVIENKNSSLIGYLNANDIRLYSSYRQIYCAPTLSFSGGSLIMAANHFDSKESFDLLVQYVKLEDIFWDFSNHERNNKLRQSLAKN